MATAALPKSAAKESIFEWEGKDKNGKLMRGEMRAGGEAVVNASLRRQGILVTKVRKRRTSGLESSGILTKRPGSNVGASECIA